MAGLRAVAGEVFGGYMKLAGAGVVAGAPEWVALDAKRVDMHARATALFDFVATPGDWKASIDASVWIAESEVDDLRYAIEFFTATIPTITAQPGGGYHVTADGYAAGPAA